MNQKIEITKKILELLTLDSDEQSVKKIIPIWWCSTRKKSQGGLQLTIKGFEAIRQAGIKEYRIKFLEPIEYSNKVIIWLDKYIDCPFFIQNEQIFVFSERMAVQLMLFSGNIYKFGAAKQRRVQLDNQS